MQVAGVSAAGADLTDISSITRDQWGMVCPQFKSLFAEVDSSTSANIKKLCSSKLANVFEAVKTKCSASDSVEDQTKALQTAMCQGVSAMVCFDVHCIAFL